MFQIEGAAPGDCILAVSEPGIKPAAHNVREVHGEFSHDFVVSPVSKRYYASLSCDGRSVKERTFIYPNEIGVGGVLKI